MAEKSSLIVRWGASDKRSLRLESSLAPLSEKVVLIAPSVNLATFFFFLSPQCSQCFHVRFQLWYASLPGTLSEHIHVFNVHALLCCCISGWSLQSKDKSLIHVVMISAETQWSCCWRTVVILIKKKSRHTATGKSEPPLRRRNANIQIKGHLKILYDRGKKTWLQWV